jgi:tripartite-type tricarboxylate transporter receptor subunit TctC
LQFAAGAAKLTRLQFLQLAARAAALTILSAGFLSPAAWSQTPRIVKVVVPSPAGGSSDVLIRLLGEAIRRANRPTIVVETRPGAGTIIGTEAVARAAPDGATNLKTQPPFIINALLRKVNYDPLTSFEPICHLGSEHSPIVVNSASPYLARGSSIRQWPLQVKRQISI